MGTSQVDRMLDRIEAYFKESISRHVEAITEEEPELLLHDIAVWQRGFKDIMGGLHDYPGVILCARKRSGSSPYETSYSLFMGLALTCDDTDLAERQGEAYEDILESCVREDYALGGSVLDCTKFEIESDMASNIYVIALTLDVLVDLGGYVYEKMGMSEVRTQGNGTDSVPSPVFGLQDGNGASGEEAAFESASPQIGELNSEV